MKITSKTLLHHCALGCWRISPVNSVVLQGGLEAVAPEPSAKHKPHGGRAAHLHNSWLLLLGVRKLHHQMLGAGKTQEVVQQAADSRQGLTTALLDHNTSGES